MVETRLAKNRSFFSKSFLIRFINREQMAVREKCKYFSSYLRVLIQFPRKQNANYIFYRTRRISSSKEENVLQILVLVVEAFRLKKRPFNRKRFMEEESVSTRVITLRRPAFGSHLTLYNATSSAFFIT